MLHMEHQPAYKYKLPFTALSKRDHNAKQIVDWSLSHFTTTSGETDFQMNSSKDIKSVPVCVLKFAIEYEIIGMIRFHQVMF